MSAIKEKFYLNNTSLPTAETEFKWTPEMVKHLNKCRKDIVYFAEKFFYIINPDDGRQLIKLRKYQRRILKSFKDHNRLVFLSPRQASKTTILTICALWTALFFEDQRVIIAANKEATAINIFKRIKLAYELVPNYLKSGVIEYAKTGMSLANGSSIGITTTSSDSARGESCSLLLLDECAFIPPEFMNEFWSAVYPVISASKRAKIMVSSTPNGAVGLFYELYTNAEKGTNGWKSEKIEWWEIPGRDEAWKQKTIKELGSIDVWNQEFDNQFLNTGESVTADDIQAKLKQSCKEPEFIFDNGNYRVWEEPNKDAIYVAGVDISEGVNNDASVIHVFDFTDLTNIRQVATYHNRKIVPYLFTQKLLDILRQWGNPLVAIERNNCGAQVIDSLRNIHSYEKLLNYSPKTDDDRLGCIAHTNTKGLGVTNMRYWINQLNAVTLRDIHTVNELKDFIRHDNGTWSAKSGADIYDDRVMSMMWALVVLNGVITDKYFEVIKWDDNDKPLIIRPWDYEDKKDMISPVHLYQNERPMSDEERGKFTLPTIFQNVKMGEGDEDPTLVELEEQGWERLQ